MPKLGATALGYYKLVPQPAPLSSYAPSEPALTSNRPPQLPNLGFSPNLSRTPHCVSSPWPALHRSDHALLALVSALLCALNASRPGQLNKDHVRSPGTPRIILSLRHHRGQSDLESELCN
jgi:hypothetical protein